MLIAPISRMTFEDQSLFVARRVVAFASLCAFASLGQQADALFGSCGLYEVPLFFGAQKFPALVVKLICGIGAVISFLDFIAKLKAYPVILPILYGSLQIISSAAVADGVTLTHADWLLLEALVILHPKIWNKNVGNFFVGRLLLHALASKLIGCDANGQDWLGIKFDAVNQPFPFTPVWHLNRLPDSLVGALNVSVILVEGTVGVCLIVLPLLFLKSSAADSKAPRVAPPSFIDGLKLFASVSSFVYSLFFMVVGNFNWSLPLLAAFALAGMPGPFVEGLLGAELLRRWGCKSRGELSKEDLEILVVHSLTFGAIGFLCFGGLVLQGPVRGVITPNMIAEFLPNALVVLGWVFAFCLLKSTSKAVALLSILFAIFSQDAIGRSIVLMNFETDFSSTLACSTFPEHAAGRHTREGRATVIFGARVDSALPEDRYTELSFPAAIHIEDIRPTHLLFHFPRLSLMAWRSLARPKEGSNSLLEKVRARVAAGHASVRSLFSDAPESRIRKVIGKRVKEAFGYFQVYGLTERMADHQWYTKKGKYGVFLDGKIAPVTLPECLDEAPVFPWVNVQSFVVTAGFAALIARLLFLG